MCALTLTDKTAPSPMAGLVFKYVWLYIFFFEDFLGLACALVHAIVSHETSFTLKIFSGSVWKKMHIYMNELKNALQS